VSGGKFW